MSGPLAQVGFSEEWWIQILKALFFALVGLQLVPLVLLTERKVLGRFQNRYGPNRVGPYGLLTPVADIVKLLSKEQFRPRTSVGWLFAIAPILSITAAFGALALIPYGDIVDIAGYPVGLYGVDVSIGPLYVFAFGAIAFYGLMLGGWSSGSKYSFLGSMRAAAQLISYEVAQGMALIGVVITAQTLSLTGIVKAQDGMWYIVPQIFGFLIFMVASFAETNRPPFDLVEADAELVGGYNTEFGGGKFALYYFAEYMNVIVISGPGDDDVPRRLAAAVRDHRAGLGRVLRRDREDDDLRHPLHLDPRDAAPPALRPADGLRLEGPAAPRDPQHARHGDRRRGDRLGPA